MPDSDSESEPNGFRDSDGEDEQLEDDKPLGQLLEERKDGTRGRKPGGW